MIFNSSNVQDISRYYKNTFVKFKEHGDELFYIQNVDHYKITGTHESGEAFTLYLNDETPYEIEYILPHKSFFQYQGRAVMLQRIPAKQYHRGLCAENTQLMFLEGRPLTMDLGFEVLKAFVSKKHFSSLVAAVGDSEATTLALSPRMMYHRGNGQLYVDFTPVATVNRGKMTISVKKTIFMEEIVELLNSRNEQDKWKVEVFVPSVKTKADTLLKEMGEPSALKKPAKFVNADLNLPAFQQVELE